MIRLADPLMLLLLLLPVAALLWMLRTRRPSRPRMKYSSLALLRGGGSSWRVGLLWLPRLLTVLACLLVIVAMSRPQSSWRESKNFTEGIDIMLVIDVSDSMHALDFTPNRLEKAKAVVKDFIKDRENDQLGVVIFGKDAFTLCPLTQDRAALTTFINRIDFDLVDGQATAIGMGLASAVNTLRKSKAKSKVVILLTDGENNSGDIDPIAAAEIAKAFGVRVYTIGVGSEGYVRIMQQTPLGPRVTRMPSHLDVKQLTQIAEMTGGQFFHATDDKSLEKIYAQINTMEQTRFEASETHYFDELGQYLIFPALVLLALGFLMENSVLRTYP